eukprot:3934745-Rhodomonas_salina.1
MGLSKSDYMGGDRPGWVLRWAGQIILGVDQIYWTKECEDAIREAKLKEYHAKCHQQLLDVTKLVRTDLTGLQRVSLGALVTLDVHGRDVIENLANADVKDPGEFEWSAQLRYYWEESERAFSGTECTFLNQVENKFRYGCEYLGAVFLNFFAVEKPSRRVLAISSEIRLMMCVMSRWLILNNSLGMLAAAGNTDNACDDDEYSDDDVSDVSGTDRVRWTGNAVGREYHAPRHHTAHRQVTQLRFQKQTPTTSTQHCCPHALQSVRCNS